MRFKKGVGIRGVRPELVIAIQVAVSLWPELVITSVTEGKHSRGSLHYVGSAFDVRTRHMTDVKHFADELRGSLTAEFDVVVERDHIHVEFQPKEPLKPTV